MSAPSAEEQIIFLQQIQRLLNEGEFTATYKFALLLALAELAVERGDDSGLPLQISMLAVAEKFSELYWRQMAPYQGDQAATLGLLHQNPGEHAAITRPLQKIHQDCAGQWSRAKLHLRWQDCLKQVASTIRRYPLKHLQVFGGVRQPFLYEYPCPAGEVCLLSGVAFNFRRYQGLVQQLAKSGWVEHVRSNRLNQSIIGRHDDLEVFMFGADRASLGNVAEVLAPIQDHRCFYCQERINSNAEVDHFIAWSRYPRDSAHNFVLAHRGCNNDKRDMLAARRHLERWLGWLDSRGDEIREHFSELGFAADIDASRKVAQWAYEQGVRSGVRCWLSKGATEPIQSDCIALF